MDALLGIDPTRYKLLLETIYYLIYVLGVPIAILSALRKQRQMFNLEKSKIYTELNDRYIEFLATSLQYPKLSVTDHMLEEHSPNLTPEERAQQAILYDMLTSILERSHLLYLRSDGKSSTEWRTWDLWVDRYIQKKSYRQYLREYSLNGCFDLEFESYLHKLDKQREI